MKRQRLAAAAETVQCTHTTLPMVNVYLIRWSDIEKALIRQFNSQIFSALQQIRHSDERSYQSSAVAPCPSNVMFCEAAFHL
jgi:hypothetical protein